MNLLHVEFTARAILLVLLFYSGAQSCYFPLQCLLPILWHFGHLLWNLLGFEETLVDSYSLFLCQGIKAYLLKPLIDSHFLVTLYFLEKANLLIFPINVEIGNCSIKVLIISITLNFITRMTSM